MEQELIGKIKEAMRELYIEDVCLFQDDISERCLAYNFSRHFWKALELKDDAELKLDLEYNRNCGKAKTLSIQSTSYPDLILHEREKNDNNILVIEFKKWNNKSKLNKDREKLMCFKREYGYRLCMLIVFDKNSSEKVKYEIIQ